MTHVNEYLVPLSLTEALKLLKARGNAAALVAGGTVQALHLPSRVTTLIDLSRCGLETVAIDAKRATLGATVSAATLAGMPELDAFGTGLLREAAAEVSPQAVRNQVTVAGNLAGYLSWSDLPVAFAALDATVSVAKAPNKKRTVALSKLFAEHPRKVLAQDEIITGVVLERSGMNTGGAFLKLARTAADIGLVSAAALLTVDKGVCTKAAIAFGAVQPRPVRAAKAEAMLVGRELSEELFAQAAHLAAADAVVHADMRASKEYRQEVLAVTIKRALCTAWRRATGEEVFTAPRRLLPPAWPKTAVNPDCGTVLELTVDGARRRFAIKPTDLLLDVLRREGVTAVKRGCDEGYCGTCSVLVGGRVLNACVVLAAHVDGLVLTTAAGLGSVMHPHPIQTALVEAGGVQCGFCTPGFVVAAKSFLDQVPNPTDEELRYALDGNLCRCTGYTKPLLAIHNAAGALRRVSQSR